MPRPCLPLRVRGIGRFRLTRPSDDVRSARVSTRPGPGASRTTRGVVNPAWETFAAFGLRQPVLASCATRGRVLATRQRAPELPWRGGRSSGYARPRSRGLPRFHHRASRPFRQSFRQAPWGIALRIIPSPEPRGRSLQNEAPQKTCRLPISSSPEVDQFLCNSLKEWSTTANRVASGLAERTSFAAPSSVAPLARGRAAPRVGAHAPLGAMKASPQRARCRSSPSAPAPRTELEERALARGKVRADFFDVCARKRLEWEYIGG